ncbi:hypothetical protein ACIQM3_02205 [Streptomyces sp. NPDC091271]|uniref:hypothetical protein n=1 Tax=Streptomyces sp. NPDC091271 TaxID=3365980 RepID=UPI0038147084
MPCQSGAAAGLAGVRISVAAMIVLLVHFWRVGVRGPMPAAAVPGLLGAVLGVRFLWSAPWWPPPGHLF